MASTVKFEFSKCFFAEYLCVSVDKVSFAVMRHGNEEYSFESPVIKVKGIDGLVFNIKTRNFDILSANHSLIPAKIKKYRDKVIFSTKDGAEIRYDLDEFRKYYMRRIVSSLIKDASAAHEIPTIRKNKWEEEHQVLLLELNKRFWSKLLHVTPQEITYGILKVNYYIDDELEMLQSTDLVPVLKIKGVSAYYFNIEYGRFFKPEEYNGEFNHRYWGGKLLTEYVPAKIVYSRVKVVFSTKEGERVEWEKADLYRQYLGMVANSFLIRE